MDWRDRNYYPPGWEVDTVKKTLVHDDVVIHCDFIVCPGCTGRGMCVNPNVDRNGFQSDPSDVDDWSNYINGVYDIVCPWCKGLRVVLAPQEDDPNAEQFAADV